MYPGLGINHYLAQIHYAELLEEAAQERAARSARTTNAKAGARPMVLALAAAAPLALWFAWVLIQRWRF